MSITLPTFYLTQGLRWIIIFTVAAFFLTSLLALDMGSDHQMDMGCAITAPTHPITPAGSGCAMNTGEHLAWWSSTFTGIPGGKAFLTVMAVLTILLINRLDNLFSARPTGCQQRKVGSTDPPDQGIIRDYFLQFLAAGKAQPLLYA